MANAELHEASRRTPSPGLVLLKEGDEYSPGAPTAATSPASSNGSAIVDGSSQNFPQVTNPQFSNVSYPTMDIAPSEEPTGYVPRVISTLSSSSGDFASTGSLGASSRSQQQTKTAPTKRRQVSKVRSDASADPSTNRRQKRLERNRESARLSRRRRKQYLEELEEKVTDLSQAVDKGRRTHVAKSVWTIRNKRNEAVVAPSTTNLSSLEKGLARTSNELMIVTTFRTQQLKSFALPPSTKFMLWLTLQNDAYFRGGRAASERLSAARIGERMLNSGTDRVTPAQSMWPLLCNEVGLSYDQEEKVRNFQRILVQTQESWLDRHSAFAAGKAMDSVHDATQAISLRLGQRERSSANLLSQEQRMKLMGWSARNRDRLAAKARVVTPTPSSSSFSTSPNQHVAANLYVLNHHMQNVLQTVPRAAPLVTGISLKRLSRRPSFESLGCALAPEKREEGRISRDNSFSSAGSLKRSASEISMEGEEKPHLSTVSPEDAQEVAAPLVEKVLGQFRPIMPAPPEPMVASMPQDDTTSGFTLPAPTPVSCMSFTNTYSVAPAPVGSASQLVANHPGAVMMDTGDNPPSGHVRKSSFLPANLTVVPEEMWPDGVENDFLMNLVDEDWGIGVGVDMDIGHQ